MWRARRENIPPLPTSRDDTDLSGDWSLSIAGERFLLHQGSDMIIFATDQFLRLLAECDTIFMDGTFKAAPKQFKQLYTIRGTYRGHFITLVYALLSAKTQATYFNMFGHNRRQMMELEHDFSPTTIVSDLESALQPRVPTVRAESVIITSPRLFGDMYKHSVSPYYIKKMLLCGH